jgi:hypothetical protein
MAIIPTELHRLDTHPHGDVMFVYMKDIVELLGLERFSHSEDRGALQMTGEKYFERLRDPLFTSPCQPECFPLLVFVHTYIARFPGLFPLDKHCCSGSGHGTVCSQGESAKKATKILSSNISTKGVTHNEAIDLVMQNCGACVLRDRNASVATVNRIIKASILFEIKNETVFFSYYPSEERMKEFDRKSKLIPKPFAGPMAALY